MRVFNVQVELATQEDGLWRATVPNLPGCWVDAPTMEQAISDIQEAVAMFIDVLEERGETLPSSVKPDTGTRITAKIPVDAAAYHFSRPSKARTKSVAR